MTPEEGMGASEERRFHAAQDRVNLKVESRITRLEVMLYVVITLTGLNFLGIHILDAVTLLKP